MRARLLLKKYAVIARVREFLWEVHADYDLHHWYIQLGGRTHLTNISLKPESIPLIKGYLLARAKIGPAVIRKYDEYGNFWGRIEKDRNAIGIYC